MGVGAQIFGDNENDYKSEDHKDQNQQITGVVKE
jgi:hypothetical protein